MSNALYFLRTKVTEKGCEIAKDRYGLELDFSDRRKKIYTNNDMLILVARKYIMIYLFNEEKCPLEKELLCLMGGN